MTPASFILPGAFLAGWYLLVGMGVTVGFHRVLAHRSAALSPWLLYPLVVFGLAAGPPVPWAGNHRLHHRNTDEEGDPHSPVREGFWYAHCGWYLGIRRPWACALYAVAGPLRFGIDALLRPMFPGGHAEHASDLATNRFLRFLSTRSGFALFGSLQLVPFWVAWRYGGWGLVALFWCAGVVMYNLGDAVNSVLHLSGNRDFDGAAASRNLGWLAIATLGEGWHNGHHAFPASARLGLLPGQADPGWWFIRSAERLGLATRVRLPPPDAVESRRRA